MSRQDDLLFRAHNPDVFELDDHERLALSDMALLRYRQWRTRRHNRLSRDDAYAAALALTRNDVSQKARRLAHHTGADR